MSIETATIKRQRGVTLLELLIVVAIIAMISSFAYPSYIRYIVNAKRTAATSMLLQVADRQQQFFMDNKAYANDLTALGYAANPLVITEDGTPTAAGDGDAVYSISLGNLGATTYTATAAPLHGQATRDTDCGSLSITQAGNKSTTGGGDKCW